MKKKTIFIGARPGKKDFFLFTKLPLKTDWTFPDNLPFRCQANAIGLRWLLSGLGISLPRPGTNQLVEVEIFAKKPRRKN